MNIRIEQPKDYREVENLTREAFWNTYRPSCTEHYVLHKYRENPDFIPELDFVMEEDGKIIGHVMYSKATIVREDGGTNADGSVSFDYCQYCYKDGKFLQDCTMDEMIDHCSRFVDEVNKHIPEPITREQYKDQMRQYFPLLKRWRRFDKLSDRN